MNRNFTFLILISAFFSAFAQTGYYQVPLSDIGNPLNLNKDLEFPVGSQGASTGWTNIASSVCTNVWSSDVAIPFAFKFNDESVSKFKANCGGIVSFSSPTAPTVGTLTSLPNAAIPDKSITLFGLNLAAATGDFVATKTFGSAPNRQFWIQWNSASEVNLGAAGWSYMSIVLEETTNNIYIVDQRVNENNKAKVVAGIQINATTALMVNNAIYSPSNSNLPEATDNVCFTFKPGTIPANESKLVTINTESFLDKANSPFDVKYNVGNNGSNPITSLKVAYQINTNPIVEDVISGLNIAKGSSIDVTSPTKWIQTISGIFNLKVTILEVNTIVNAVINNELTKSISVASSNVKRKVLHEVFTSSTCPPCKPGNENLHTIIDDELDEQTNVKYQMDYPGTGDPYYNTENKVRYTYYGIRAIPYTSVDGNKFNDNANAYTQAIFDGIKPNKSFLEIKLDAKNLWQNKMTCNVTINPKITLNNPNLRLFVVVVEKETTKNVKTNQETSFSNVAKKIMPSATGEVINGFTDSIAYNKTFSFTFKGSYKLPINATAPVNLNTDNTIENWGNLGIVAFVQDIVTKDVLQSEFANMSNNNVENISYKMNMFPNPTSESTLIYIDAFKGIQTKIELINMLGQVLYKTTVNNGQCEINTSKFAGGIYTVKASNANAYASQKLTVTK